MIGTARLHPAGRYFFVLCYGSMHDLVLNQAGNTVTQIVARVFCQCSSLEWTTFPEGSLAPALDNNDFCAI